MRSSTGGGQLLPDASLWTILTAERFYRCSVMTTVPATMSPSRW
jgi:hypothetical protein